MWEYVVIAVLSVLLFLHWTIEILYFLRAASTVFVSRFFKNRINVMDSAIYAVLCTTTDVDFLLSHMNNARYLRELDFARIDFYERTGLLAAIQSKNGAFFQGASTIRYRRFIRPFTVYNIISKIIYWEGDAIYMEHKFVTPGDQFVRAIVMGKQRLVGCTADEIIALAMSGGGGGKPAAVPPQNAASVGIARPVSPPRQPPPELALWIESNAVSSAQLRSNDHQPTDVQAV